MPVLPYRSDEAGASARLCRASVCLRKTGAPRRPRLVRRSTELAAGLTPPLRRLRYSVPRAASGRKGDRQGGLGQLPGAFAAPGARADVNSRRAVAQPPPASLRLTVAGSGPVLRIAAIRRADRHVKPPSI